MGFSILEVSLVIIIVASLALASFKVKNFSENIKINNFIIELSLLRKDVQDFYQLFSYYPGDLPYSNELSESQCVEFQTGDLFCAGNGDGKITDKTEGYLAWLQLNQFRNQLFVPKFPIIESARIGINVKKSQIYENIGFQFLSDSKLNNLSFYFPSYVSNFIRIAAEQKQGNLLNAAFNTKNAFYIDQKIDDGFPLRGELYADNANDTDYECVNSLGNYNINIRQKSCYLQLAF